MMIRLVCAIIRSLYSLRSKFGNQEQEHINIDLYMPNKKSQRFYYTGYWKYPDLMKKK